MRVFEMLRAAMRRVVGPAAMKFRGNSCGDSEAGPVGKSERIFFAATAESERRLLRRQPFANAGLTAGSDILRIITSRVLPQNSKFRRRITLSATRSVARRRDSQPHRAWDSAC